MQQLVNSVLRPFSLCHTTRPSLTDLTWSDAVACYGSENDNAQSDATKQLFLASLAAFHMVRDVGWRLMQLASCVDALLALQHNSPKVY